MDKVTHAMADGRDRLELGWAASLSSTHHWPASPTALHMLAVLLEGREALEGRKCCAVSC